MNTCVLNKLQEHGHTEDILTIADCQPNYLATASYDGEVIVWNIVSGHVFCHLRAPPPPSYKDQSCTTSGSFLLPFLIE